MNRLLRIEAVNLLHSIDDTEDLNTRRGGGYLLLQAVRDVENKFRDQLSPISTGASIGLFNLSDATLDESKVREYLCQHPDYRHATFVVDRVAHADFRTCVEASLARNRWQQMHTLNFSTEWGRCSEVCGTDEIRPAAAKQKYKNRPTSLSVHVRSNAGRELRQGFYEQELGGLGSSTAFACGMDSFADNTEELSTFRQLGDYAAIPANLNGKMAVFYADGNGFGKIQQACESDIDLNAWDRDLKAKRRRLLHDLLAWQASTSLGRTQEGKLRFETLLWGGDEMLFLLPAWLGLEFAQRFFELTASWDYQGQKLTHSAGLVFAKHNAPISRLQKLAKEKLAEFGKQYDRQQNSLSWIVLESFDHVGNNITKFWQRNGIEEDGWQKLLLSEEKIRRLRGLIPALKNDLPRSAMIRVLRSLAAGKAAKEVRLLRRSYASTDEALATQNRGEFASLWHLLCGSFWENDSSSQEAAMLPAADVVAWTILLELWDYLLPDAPLLSTGGTP